MLNNKIVVIVGGAGLLGRAFCKAAARQGAHVVVADRDLAAASALAQEIAANGGKAEAAVIEIGDQASVDQLIASLHARHGRIDAVVNSAYPRNANYGRSFEAVQYADFCDNISLHLGGYFLVAQRFGLHFREHGGGAIVNLGSIYGSMTPRFEVYAGTPMTMPVEYAAIKAGVLQITRYMAQWFKGSGVRVNCLSPGGIENGQPQEFLAAYREHCASKGMLDAQDVCGTLLFLLSDAAQHITGQNLIVDDGFSL